jgi:serine/threonine protein kinase/WD40 repeat protein
MTAMTSPETCRECGTALPSGSPGGFCPKCMLGLALDGDSSTDKPESSKTAEFAEPLRDNGPNDPKSGSLSKTGIAENLSNEIPGYRLLQEIGHGGCGIVYMAEQERPVHRRVALKVIKIGMDTRQVVARFEAERQALARMDHPNIAKVLEAGATRSGRPYFAMELVGGLKITDYCDLNELTTDERLRLFVQVCRAIQHAHQKGIIHRDIKPSNVLVAQHDGVAVPKVIDFGIAKATQGKLIDETLFTAFEQFIGTPVYMSPEQAELGGLDVDTRSDIYSLGVLLYELLTGKTPFKMDSSKLAGVEAIRRTVVEKEPVKPSSRLNAMREEQLTTVARARQIDPPKLLKLVRGDLDWIAMKCLEKNRGRRYETANGLAMDIQRYLNNEPVLACPPSAIYQIRKFIGRNRLATLSATAISLALILGTAVSTWQAVKATRAEREQSRLRQEAQNAKQQATEELWRSYLAEARARRLSREAGASFDSLAAIAKAAAIRPSLELRNEAIASMVQADIRWLSDKQFDSSLSRRGGMVDLAAVRYAVCDPAGMVSIRRVSDDVDLARLPPTNSPAIDVWCFSPNGILVVVRYADHRVRAWDWERSRCLLDLENPVTVDISQDSEQMVVYDARKVALFKLGTASGAPATKIKTFELDGGPWSFRFHPAGRMLAAYGEQQTNLLILDLNTGKIFMTLPHDAGIYRLAWSADGKYLATTCKDIFVHIWDVESGKLFRTLPSNQSISVAFNPRGNLLITSGWDGRTRLWDFPNCRSLVNIYQAGSILGFSQDGRSLIETHWDGSAANFFEVADPRGLHTLYVHDKGPRPPSGITTFSHDGNLLAFTTAEGVCLWDARADVELGLYPNERASLIGFDSADRNLIIADPEGLLLCPLTALRNSISNATGFQSSPSPVTLAPTRLPERLIGTGGAISPDGEYCFVTGNHRCQILNTRTFQNSVFTGVHSGARYVAANSDGSLVATGAWLSPDVMVWDGHTGNLVKSLQIPDGTSVAFSPNGRVLVTATHQRYVFWQVDSWSEVLSIPQQKGNDFCPMMAFSPDGRLFAGTHSRNVVRLHDAATGEVLADLEPPDPHMVTAISFNEDGSRLAVGEGYEATRIWDLQIIRSNLAPMGLDWKIASNSSIPQKNLSPR